MAASVQFRVQNRDLGMVMREVDEDLAIFLGMRGSEHVIIDEFDESMRAENVKIVADDNLISLEIENSEYDWLTPEKIDPQDSTTDVSKDDSVSSKSEACMSNSCEKSSLGSCNGANRKSSSSGYRKSAPTERRPSLSEKSKPFHATTPSSRATLAPSQASLRPTLTSSKPVATQVRSSTPSRPSTTASRTSRSGTPTRKPATPLTASSQTVKSRPSKELDAPKTSMPKRPASASRGRPSVAAHSCSKARQKSCSPAKVRASNGNNGKIMLSRSQGYRHGGSDNVNPVLMGTKMVERVVNMRKLAPPKLVSPDKTKKSSQDKSGFGRSLSKRSLDMAIRHMDIRRSLNIPGNLRPVATGVSSSGNQCSSSGSSTIGFSDTSASDSSKSSNCVDSYFLDD